MNPSPRNFTNAKFHKARTDGEFFWVIKNGSAGTGMVPLIGTAITEEEAWYVIPIGAFGGIKSMKLFPASRRMRSKHEKYREAWCWMCCGREGLGVVRHFRVGAGDSPLSLNLEPQPDAEVVLTGLEHDGLNARFDAKAGGEFTIESSYGKGTTMTVTLPG